MALAEMPVLASMSATVTAPVLNKSNANLVSSWEIPSEASMPWR